jgi:hypothetical protein
MDSRWGRGLPLPQPNFLYNEYWISFQVLKRLRRGADHPSHPAPRLKKEKNYTCIPSSGPSRHVLGWILRCGRKWSCRTPCWPYRPNNCGGWMTKHSACFEINTVRLGHCRHINQDFDFYVTWKFSTRFHKRQLFSCIQVHLPLSSHLLHPLPVDCFSMWLVSVVVRHTVTAHARRLKEPVTRTRNCLVATKQKTQHMSASHVLFFIALLFQGNRSCF